MALYTVSTGGAIAAADVNQYYNLLTGSTTDQQVTVANRIRANITGATGGSGGYVGGTTSGAPTSGTFNAGDFIIDGVGAAWVCTTGGTPGTWTAAAGNREARKTADNTPVNNSTTLVNDADLVLAVTASAVYEMYTVVRYSSNTTANIKFAWTFPAGLTMAYNETLVPASGGNWSTFAIDQTASVAALGASPGTVELHGLVTVSSTAGNLQLQFAQNTANASNTFTQAGSYMRLTRIA